MPDGVRGSAKSEPRFVHSCVACHRPGDLPLLWGVMRLKQLDEWKSFQLRFYNTWILNSIY